MPTVWLALALLKAPTEDQVHFEIRASMNSMASPTKLRLSEDGKLCAIVARGRTYVWNVESRTPLGSVAGGYFDCQWIGNDLELVSGLGKLYTAAAPGFEPKSSSNATLMNGCQLLSKGFGYGVVGAKLYRWDLASGARTQGVKLFEESYELTVQALSANGSFLASSLPKGGISVVSTDGLKEIRHLDFQFSQVNRIAVANDGNLVAEQAQNGDIALFSKDHSAPFLIKSAQLGTGYHNGDLAFSTDGTHLESGGSSIVEISTANGKVTGTQSVYGSVLGYDSSGSLIVGGDIVQKLSEAAAPPPTALIESVSDLRFVDDKGDLAVIPAGGFGPNQQMILMNLADGSNRVAAGDGYGSAPMADGVGTRVFVQPISGAVSRHGVEFSFKNVKASLPPDFRLISEVIALDGGKSAILVSATKAALIGVDVASGSTQTLTVSPKTDGISGAPQSNRWITTETTGDLFSSQPETLIISAHQLGQADAKPVQVQGIAVGAAYVSGALTRPMAMDDKGKRLFIGDASGVLAVDLDTGTLLWSKKLDVGRIYAVASSSSGDKIVAMGSDAVALVDGQTGTVSWSKPGDSYVAAAIDSHNGLVALASSEGRITFRDTPTGSLKLTTFLCFRQRAQTGVDVSSECVCWTPDGKLESTPEVAKSLAIINGVEVAPQSELSKRAVKGLFATALGYHGGATHSNAAEDASPVSLVYPREGDTIHTLQTAVTFTSKPDATVEDVKITINGRTCVTENRLNEPAGSGPMRTYPISLVPGKNSISAKVADQFGAQAEAASVTVNCDFKESKLPVLVPITSGAVNAIAFSPDGTRAAAEFSNGLLQIWTTDSFSLERTLDGGPNSATAIGFSPDGKSVAAASTGPISKLVAWNIETGAVEVARSWAPIGLFWQADIKNLYGDVRAAYAAIPEALWCRSGTWTSIPSPDAIAAGKQLPAQLKAIVLEPNRSLLACVDASSRLAFWSVAQNRLVHAPTGGLITPFGLIAGKSASEILIPTFLDVYRLQLGAPSGSKLKLGITPGISGAPAGDYLSDVHWEGGNLLSLCHAAVTLTDVQGNRLNRVEPAGRPMIAASQIGNQLAIVEANNGDKPTGCVRRVHLGSQTGDAVSDLGNVYPLAIGPAPANAGWWVVSGIPYDGEMMSFGIREPQHGVSNIGWSLRAPTLQRVDLRGAVTTVVRLPAGDLSAAEIQNGSVFAGYVDGSSAFITPGSDPVVLSRYTSRAVRGARSADGVIAVGYEDGLVRIYGKDGSFQRALSGHADEITGLLWRPDGSLATSSFDGTIRIWNAASGLQSFEIMADVDGNPIIVDSEGRYACAKPALNNLSFRFEGSVYPYDQFDTVLNRPATVLGSLGVASQTELKVLTALEALRPPVDLQTPRPSVVAKFAIGSSSTETVNVTASAPRDRKLLKFEVTVNETPVPSIDQGAFIGVASGSGDLSIPLSYGLNRIRISATDDSGATSFAAHQDVIRSDRRPRRQLYAVLVGVSHYLELGHDLKFADADAAALGAMLQRPSAAFDAVHVTVIPDEKADRKTISDAIAGLAGAGVDDTVLLFVAGHGEVGSDKKFHFMARDAKFDDPASTALSYDEMEAMLAKSPSRHKLLLMDSCFSGFSANGVATSPTSPAKSDQATPRGNPLNAPPASIDVTSEFADFSLSSGALVVAAARGDQAAFEAAGHGYFTQALLDGLAGSADADGDGIITVRELQSFVTQEVEKRTGGSQAPTFRRDIVETDFPIATVVGMSARSGGKYAADLSAAAARQPESGLEAIASDTSIKLPEQNRELDQVHEQRSSIYTLQIRESSTGRAVASLQSAYPLLPKVEAIDADGKRVIVKTTSTDGKRLDKLVAISLTDGKVLREFSAPANEASVFFWAWQPRGDQFIAYTQNPSGGYIEHIWNVAGGNGWLVKVAGDSSFSADGRFLCETIAATGRQGYQVFNAANGSLVSSQIVQSQLVKAVGISPDGSLVAVDTEEGNLLVIDRSTGKTLHQFVGTDSIVGTREVTFVDASRIEEKTQSGWTVWKID